MQVAGRRIASLAANGVMFSRLPVSAAVFINTFPVHKFSTAAVAAASLSPSAPSSSSKLHSSSSSPPASSANISEAQRLLAIRGAAENWPVNLRREAIALRGIKNKKKRNHKKLEVQRKINEDPTIKEAHNINDAIARVKDLSWAKFDETVEIAINLNLDPRKPNQSIKGTAKMPHGVGKITRVGVFASGADATAALAAGADVVGAEDLIARCQAGDMPFDTVIATPELMSIVSKIGKVFSF
jgi:hypothetical protein